MPLSRSHLSTGPIDPLVRHKGPKLSHDQSGLSLGASVLIWVASSITVEWLSNNHLHQGHTQNVTTVQHAQPSRRTANSMGTQHSGNKCNEVMAFSTVLGESAIHG